MMFYDPYKAEVQGSESKQSLSGRELWHKQIRGDTVEIYSQNKPINRRITPEDMKEHFPFYRENRV